MSFLMIDISESDDEIKGSDSESTEANVSIGITESSDSDELTVEDYHDLFPTVKDITISMVSIDTLIEDKSTVMLTDLFMRKLEDNDVSLLENRGKYSPLPYPIPKVIENDSTQQSRDQEVLKAPVIQDVVDELNKGVSSQNVQLPSSVLWKPKKIVQKRKEKLKSDTSSVSHPLAAVPEQRTSSILDLLRKREAIRKKRLSGSSGIPTIVNTLPKPSSENDSYAREISKTIHYELPREKTKLKRRNSTNAESVLQTKETITCYQDPRISNSLYLGDDGLRRSSSGRIVKPKKIWEIPETITSKRRRRSSETCNITRKPKQSKVPTLENKDSLRQELQSNEPHIDNIDNDIYILDSPSVGCEQPTRKDAVLEQIKSNSHSSKSYKLAHVPDNLTQATKESHRNESVIDAILGQNEIPGVNKSIQASQGKPAAVVHHEVLISQKAEIHVPVTMDTDMSPIIQKTEIHEPAAMNMGKSPVIQKSEIHEPVAKDIDKSPIIQKSEIHEPVVKDIDKSRIIQKSEIHEPVVMDIDKSPIIQKSEIHKPVVMDIDKSPIIQKSEIHEPVVMYIDKSPIIQKSEIYEPVVININKSSIIQKSEKDNPEAMDNEVNHIPKISKNEKPVEVTNEETVTVQDTELTNADMDDIFSLLEWPLTGEESSYTNEVSDHTALSLQESLLSSPTLIPGNMSHKLLVSVGSNPVCSSPIIENPFSNEGLMNLDFASLEANMFSFSDFLSENSSPVKTFELKYGETNSDVLTPPSSPMRMDQSWTNHQSSGLWISPKANSFSQIREILGQSQSPPTMMLDPGYTKGRFYLMSHEGHPLRMVQYNGTGFDVIGVDEIDRFRSEANGGDSIILMKS